MRTCDVGHGWTLVVVLMLGCGALVSAEDITVTGTDTGVESYTASGRATVQSYTATETADVTISASQGVGLVAPVSIRTGAQFRIVVGNQAPVAVASSIPEIDINNTVSLDASGSYDPDAAPAALTYQWEYLAGPAEPTVVDSQNAVASFVPAQVGYYTFKVTVSDGVLTDTRTIDVHVVDKPPYAVFTADVPKVIREGRTFTVHIEFSEPVKHQINDAEWDSSLFLSAGDFYYANCRLHGDTFATIPANGNPISGASIDVTVYTSSSNIVSGPVEFGLLPGAIVDLSGNPNESQRVALTNLYLDTNFPDTGNDPGLLVDAGDQIDLQAFAENDQGYRDEITGQYRPGRVWQTRAAGVDGNDVIPVLRAHGSRLRTISAGQPLNLVVEIDATDGVAPGIAPVTYTSTGGATVAGEVSVTVASDASDGQAQVVFRAQNRGVYPVIVGSPAASGRVVFRVTVTD